MLRLLWLFGTFLLALGIIDFIAFPFVLPYVSGTPYQPYLLVLMVALPVTGAVIRLECAVREV